MKYFLFFKNGKRPPDYIRSFRTMDSLYIHIRNEIKALRKAYPGVKFSVKDYMIAKRWK